MKICTAQHSHSTDAAATDMRWGENFTPASSTVHLRRQKWKNYYNWSTFVQVTI